MSREQIDAGLAVLGIELGSTRIKLVLVGESHEVLASGVHQWENQLENELWTYSLDSVWEGLQGAFAELQQNVGDKFGTRIRDLKAIGVSAMMHGYLAFDDKDQLLVPFRTWRNTNTQLAATELTELFGVNIPLRWSIAHLHQVVLEKAEHVPKISFLTTLAGYVHWKLTDRKVLGIGDASGMFPIDSSTKNYDAVMLTKYDALAGAKRLGKKLKSLLPEILIAGESGGVLTVAGSRLLDTSSSLRPGALLCPPEGDAGSGMVATNSVSPETGNVSAGTSIFAMVVMDKPLSEVHHELDIVTTPMGDPVAMVHCNNGASEMAAWVSMFERFAELAGLKMNSDDVYSLLFQEAATGAADAGGLVAYNYLAGEPITGINAGRPLFVRTPDSEFSLANALRAQLYGVFATLNIGMQVLFHEGVTLSRLSAHGGIFRSADVAQRFLSAAVKAPVSVSATASEGGPWGMAILASFAQSGESNLEQYLQNQVFIKSDDVTVIAGEDEIAGFEDYMASYTPGLAIMSKAVEVL